MVLINRLFLGLVLLISSTWSLTTFSKNSTSPPKTTPNVTSPVIKKSQDETIPNSTLPTILKQTLLNSSSTELKPEINYNVYSGTTSTEIPNEKFKNEDNSRSVNTKGGRSLDVLSDFHSENNVVFDRDYEKEQSSKTREYERSFNFELTTPESDSRFKQIQEDVLKKFDEKAKIVAGEMEEDKRKYFVNHNGEEPKNPFLDNEDNVEGNEDFQSEERKNVDINEFKDKNKNKTRWEHSVESLNRTESVKVYNQTEIIDDKKNFQNEVKDDDDKKNLKNKKPIDLDQESSVQITSSLNQDVSNLDEFLVKKRDSNQLLTSPREINSVDTTISQFINFNQEEDETTTKIDDETLKNEEEITKKIDKDTKNIEEPIKNRKSTGNDSKIIPEEKESIKKYDFRKINENLTEIVEDSTKIDVNLRKIDDLTTIDETSTKIDDSMKIDEDSLKNEEKSRKIDDNLTKIGKNSKKIDDDSTKNNEPMKIDKKSMEVDKDTTKIQQKLTLTKGIGEKSTEIVKDSTKNDENSRKIDNLTKIDENSSKNKDPTETDEKIGKDSIKIYEDSTKIDESSRKIEDSTKFYGESTEIVKDSTKIDNDSTIIDEDPRKIDENSKKNKDLSKIDQESTKIEDSTRIHGKSTGIVKDSSNIAKDSKKIDDESTKMVESTKTDESIKIDESTKIDGSTKIDEYTKIDEESTKMNNPIKIDEDVKNPLKIEEETTLNDQGTISEEITTVEIESTQTVKNTDSIENVFNNTETTQSVIAETTTFANFDETRTNFGGLLGDLLTNSTEFAPEIITTTIKYDDDDYDEDKINATTFYVITTDRLIEFFKATEKIKTNEIKKNETISNVANEILKISSNSPSSQSTSTESNEVKTISVSKEIISTTEKMVSQFNFSGNNPSYKTNENDIIKQNEINDTDGKMKKTTEKPPTVEDYFHEDSDDDENNNENTDEDAEDHSNKPVMIHFDGKITLKPTKSVVKTTTVPVEIDESNNVEAKSKFVNASVNYSGATELEVTTTPAGLVDDGGDDDEDEGNGGKIAAIVISTVGAVCLLLLVGLLIVMRKRQKRFNYGQRCRPVSLDAYSMDNVSIHNSTRRKGVLMTSKRAYGNAAFEDPNSPSHPLNFSELVKFANNTEEIHTEFEQIPQVQAKTSELPEGCEVKNRYANVIPLPETRVFLKTIESDPTSDYINANYVTGAKSERRYYIACQAPLQSTIGDFWRMIWEQESKVILMLTHLYEQGVEKCSDYLPPSEVLDCNRLFGDFQVTLKKREVRDKYIISSLQLKNMVSNSWREVTHIWYVEWPHKGVPDEANSLIRFLIEARSYMKANEIKAREATFIQGTVPRNPPVIVHCSPGTGRTGTVLSCDIAIREFEQSRQVDIPKIVYKIRRDRASSVQTKEQYSFIYKVINLYATKLTGGAFDSF